MELTMTNAGHCYSCEASAQGLSESFDFTDDPREICLTREFDGTYSVEIDGFEEESVFTNLKKYRIDNQFWELKNNYVKIVIYTELFDYTIDGIFQKLGKDPHQEKLSILNISLKGAEEDEDYELCNIIKHELKKVKLGKFKNVKF